MTTGTAPIRLVRYDRIAKAIPRSKKTLQNLAYAKKIAFLGARGFDGRQTKDLFLDADGLQAWLLQKGFNEKVCLGVADAIDKWAQTAHWPIEGVTS